LALNATKVRFYEYNYQQHQHYAATTQGQAVPALRQHPFGQLVQQQSEQLFVQESHTPAETRIQSGGELQAEARDFHQQRVAELIALQGESEDASLQLGRVIRVRGEGLGSSHGQPTDFGAYRLVEITHQLDAEGNYHNTFTALPYLLDLPPHNPSYAPPAGVPELAEVIDTADPDHLGRVRVRYYWPVTNPTHAETDWVRTLTPYSGDGKGHLFTPEIGSQVLVGYANGLAEQPLVLGNLFHGHNQQGAKYTTPQNQRKGLQTAGGNKFVMTDTQGAQQILISNSNNKTTAVTVSFQGDGSVHIESKGPVTVNGSVITLEAGNQGEINLHAKTITLVAEDNVVVNAKTQGIALTATEKLALTSKDLLAVGTTSATLRSDQALTLNGGDKATLQSGETQVH